MAGPGVHALATDAGDVAAGGRDTAPAGEAGRTAAGPAERSVRRFERRAMGSRLRLTVTGASAGVALLAWGRVSDEFERAEQAMSRFRDSSDLSHLNRAVGSGALVEVDRRLRRALVAAWRAQRVTGGRFDPRVLRDLERLGYRGAPLGARGAPPAPSLLGAREAPAASPLVRPPARDHPAHRAGWLVLAGRTSAAGVTEPVDLGGIGKGLALRWAWRRLRATLATGDGVGALLEAGGDLVAGGGSPDGGPWLVGIEDPTGGSEPLAVVRVVRGAVCTSSLAVHRWHDPSGRPVHHLIDPVTGEPGGEGLLSVTVAGPDPAWAEVWSKALFLEGARGIATLARRRGLAAWWVTASGDLEMTPAARPRTAWLR